MRRLGSAVAAAGALFLALPARPAAAADAPAAVSVSMKQFAFMPASITVAVGGTVTWTYDEEPTDVPGCESPVFQTVPGVNCPGHSATAAAAGPDGAPLFDSGVHRADGFPFTTRFTAPGTYEYFCTVHGGPNPNNPLTAMNGTVVVTAASAPVASGAANDAGTTATTAPPQVQGAVLARTGPNGGPWSVVGAMALAVVLVLRRLSPFSPRVLYHGPNRARTGPGGRGHAEGRDRTAPGRRRPAGDHRG
jgi:plastocyanin